MWLKKILSLNLIYFILFFILHLSSSLRFINGGAYLFLAIKRIVIKEKRIGKKN
jgi:hypothetical protein